MSSEAPRIVHVSLRVRDLETSTRFYQQLFGFRRLGDSRSRDHVSRHLTDGVIDLALIEYPGDRGRADCPTPGAAPGIHHFGVAVADLEAWTRRAREAGGELLTPPGEVPVKFRDPDGAICELVPFGRYQVASPPFQEEPSMHLTHMAPTARMIIETLLKVQPGEQVCLLTDTECPRSITETIAAIAAAAGAEVHVVVITPRPVGSVEPTPVVRAAFAAADVIINQSSFAVVHTDGLRQALSRGARMVEMWGFTEDMMVRGGATVDYPKMTAVSRRLGEALSRGRAARLTTPDGTDLTMSLEGRDGFVLAGYADQKGAFTALPDGEAGISPITGTAEGRLVKPFCIEVRGLGFVGETITVEVKGGRVVGARGGPQAALLMETLDRAGYPAHNVAEFAMGTNDKCRLGVALREAKKAWGTAHIGLGDSKSVGGDVHGPLHFDMIFLKPTVAVDGQVLVRDGQIVV